MCSLLFVRNTTKRLFDPYLHIEHTYLRIEFIYKKFKTGPNCFHPRTNWTMKNAHHWAKLLGNTLPMPWEGWVLNGT